MNTDRRQHARPPIPTPTLLHPSACSTTETRSARSKHGQSEPRMNADARGSAWPRMHTNRHEWHDPNQERFWPPSPRRRSRPASARRFAGLRAGCRDPLTLCSPWRPWPLAVHLLRPRITRMHAKDGFVLRPRQTDGQSALNEEPRKPGGSHESPVQPPIHPIIHSSSHPQPQMHADERGWG